MHDQNFEKEGKTSCGIDELITFLYNTNLPVWWVDRSDEPVLVFLHSFLWRKLFLISLFFIHYRVIKLWFFWGNYFWSNFSSLDGLFYLFMVYSYFIIVTLTSRIKGHFLMTHVLQQVFTLLYMKYQWTFSFWTPFLFSLDSFTEQLDFYLLTLESSVIF